ncbi:unnamed protein product, partial [Ceratitis capitata]
NLAAFDTPKNLAAANNSLNSKRTLNAQLTKCTYNGSVAAPEVHGSGGKFYHYSTNSWLNCSTIGHSGGGGGGRTVT